MAKGNGEFKGSGGQYFGTVFIHLFILGTITLGIYFAWAWVRLLKLKARHTVMNGKDVSFQGTGGQLFGLMLVQGILTFITLGFYGPWAFCKYFDWHARNTFVGEKPSQFSGTGGSLFLFYLIHLILLPMITLGLYYFWGIYRFYAWKEEHTLYGGEETSFGGSFGEFLKVTIASWILNTLTLNLFSPWSLCMLYRWQIGGLAVGDGEVVEHFPPVKTNILAVAILVIIGLFCLLAIVFVAKNAVENRVRQIHQMVRLQQIRTAALGHRKNMKKPKGRISRPRFLKPAVTATKQMPVPPGIMKNNDALRKLRYHVQDYRDSVKRAEGLIKKNPKDAYAHYDLAWLYATNYRLGKSVSEYTRAIQINKKFEAAYYNRGLVYAGMGLLQKALKDFSNAILLNSRAADAYCNRGNVYYSLGKPDKAISDYTNALRITMGDGDVLSNRALAYKANGDLARAKQDLQRLVAAGYKKAQSRLNQLSDASSVNGAGWRMDLQGVQIPSGLAKGAVHGDPVTLDKAVFERGILTLRDGKGFFPDHAFVIFLFLKKGEIPENEIFEYSKESGFGSPHIHMKWKQRGKDLPETKIWMKDYAMLLQFGKRDGQEIPGKIYLCIPDERKSYVAGTFIAQIKS